jgi:hypothetical protein
VFVCWIGGIVFGMIVCVCWESGVGNNPVCRCMLVSRCIALTLANFQHGVIIG